MGEHAVGLSGRIDDPYSSAVLHIRSEDQGAWGEELIASLVARI
jgi:hypothetical protein